MSRVNEVSAGIDLSCAERDLKARSHGAIFSECDCVFIHRMEWVVFDLKMQVQSEKIAPCEWAFSPSEIKSLLHQHFVTIGQLTMPQTEVSSALVDLVLCKIVAKQLLHML